MNCSNKQKMVLRKIRSLYKYRLLIIGLIFLLSLLSGLQLFKVFKHFNALNRRIGALNAELAEYKNKKTAETAVQKIPEQPTKNHFEYILNNQTVCSGAPNLLYVIYIHSNPSSFKRRQVLRSTWARNDLFTIYSSRVVFIVGTPAQVEVQRKLKQEFQKHGDIIQGNFKDDARNTTRKSLMALQWITSHCSKAKYVIKAEERTFVNIFLLVDLLLHDYAGQKPVLMCMWWDNMPILRHNKSDCLQWCVGKNEFPGEKFYPRYCSGAAYILSSDALSRMYAATMTVRFFWIDDVYVTGLLTEKVHLLQWIQEKDRYEFNLHNFRIHYRQKAAPKLMVSTVDQDSFMESTWQLALHRLTGRQKGLVTEDKLKSLMTVPT